MKSLFVNDLKDIGRDLYGMFQGWVNVLLHPREAPPTVRSPDLAFVTLYSIREVGDKKEKDQPMGAFVPELYELAKLGGLKCQLEKKNQGGTESKSYITLMDGAREKTPFELAVLPVNYADENEKSYKLIQKTVEEEFNYRIKKGLPLPAVVYKYQIKSDYLKGLNCINLMVDKPRNIKLNLLNPPDRTKFLERALHWTAQRVALFLTIAAAILIIPKIPMAYIPVALTRAIIPIAVCGIIIAEWCGKDFNTYALAETLLREINSFYLTSKESKAISPKKLFKTTLLLSALLVSGAAAGAAAWFGFMGFNWVVPSSVILAKILMGTQYFLASLVAVMTTISTWIGGLVAQSFFWGIGVRDNQIDFNQERKLSPLEERQALHQAAKKTRFLDGLKREYTDEPKVIAAIAYAFASLDKKRTLESEQPTVVDKKQGLAPTPT